MSEEIQWFRPGERVEPEACTITTDKTGIVLDGHYFIEFRRIDTPAKLVSWLVHLSEKTWINSVTLRMVAKCAAKHCGYTIPWSV